MLEPSPCSTEPVGIKDFELKDASQGESNFCLSIPGAVDARSPVHKPQLSGAPREGESSPESLVLERGECRSATKDSEASFKEAYRSTTQESEASLKELFRSTTKESQASDLKRKDMSGLSNGSDSLDRSRPSTGDSSRLERSRPSTGDSSHKPRSPNTRRTSKASVDSIISAGRSAGRRTSKTARDIAVFAKERVKVDPMNFTVMTAGSILAICAGMVNAIAFLELGKFVSHVTGSISKAGLKADEGEQVEACEFAMLVLSFVLGSLVCGCLIKKDTVSFGAARYGYALIGNGVLLIVATLTSQDDIAPYFAAAACGLQNGMATSYSGAVIRTTHVTGIATDVGLIIGRLLVRCLRNTCQSWCPGRCPAANLGSVSDDVKKLILLILLGISFLCGVVCGARLRRALGADAFLVPAIIGCVAGVAYSLYRYSLRRRGMLSRAGTTVLSSIKIDPIQEEQLKVIEQQRDEIERLQEEARVQANQPCAVFNQAEFWQTQVGAERMTPATPVSELLEHLESLRPLMSAALPQKSGPEPCSPQAEAMRAYQDLKELTLKALGQAAHLP